MLRWFSNAKIRYRKGVFAARAVKKKTVNKIAEFEGCLGEISRRPLLIRVKFQFPIKDPLGPGRTGLDTENETFFGPLTTRQFKNSPQICYRGYNFVTAKPENLETLKPRLTPKTLKP